jgi:UDPglucose 6-dehydrogenase
MKNIGIIGNGFVGSAIASGFSLHAHVRIYDADSRRSTHTFEEVVNESEFIFVSVPTPMNIGNGGEIDLSILDQVLEKIENINKRNDNIIIIKSTAIPGTTLKYIKKHTGLNFVFNPEFLTERTARLDFINTSRIVIGSENPELAKRVRGLYRDRFQATQIVETDTQSAEFIKYMCNCFFSVKVSFMNEMYQMCKLKDFDWSSIMTGFLSDGRIGNSHTDVPGHDGSLGYGGKCFPKDINGFIGYFNNNNVKPTVMEASWTKNLEVRQNHDWFDIEGATSNTKKEKN